MQMLPAPLLRLSDWRVHPGCCRLRVTKTFWEAKHHLSSRSVDYFFFEWERADSIPAHVELSTRVGRHTKSCVFVEESSCSKQKTRGTLYEYLNCLLQISKWTLEDPWWHCFLRRTSKWHQKWIFGKDLMVSSPKRLPKNKARRCWCLQVLFLMTKLNILPRQLLLNPDALVTCVVLPDVGFFLPRSFVCSPAFGVRSFEWKPRAKDPWWAVDHFILDATRCGMCRAHFL